MGTVFDYIEWRGDLPFSQVPIGEVDNLVFSMISYLDFKKMVHTSPKAKPVSFLLAAKRYMQARKSDPTQTLGVLFSPEFITLMTKAARSVRFGSVYMVGYVNKISLREQKQFSAVSFLIGEDEAFVAFRGTDDTIVGWKESFNMSLLGDIPAQHEAAKYLDSIAEVFPNRKIHVGGHSKGGNLAVWASVKCSAETRERIVAVYSNDGPGFTRDFVLSPEYKQMRPKMRILVPQSSFVGVLLEHAEGYDVIQSTQTGLLQHDALSWRIVGGSFIHLDRVTDESKRIERTLKRWIQEMPPEERRRVLDSIYEVLSSNGRTLTDFSNDKTRLIRAWNTFDPETRQLIRKFIRLVVNNTKKNKVK